MTKETRIATFPDTEEVKGMKPREFAKKYGLSERVVYAAIKSGEIPAVKVGSRFVVLNREFESSAYRVTA